MHVKPRRALRPGNTGHSRACNGWQPLCRHATARAHFHHAAATEPCHRARVATPGRSHPSQQCGSARSAKPLQTMHFQRSRFLPWISAACLGAALLAGAAWAGTAEGVRAYDRGQFALAAKELQPAAQAGDPEAQFHLGLMHDFGKGVQLDHAKAAALYRKAAEQGHADAQYHLAVSYDDGEGVPQDHQQAVAWYRKAAAQNHVRAQFNLAVSYDDGEGVAQDKKQAVHWYTKAAEQGDADAQQNLSVMYARGEGVARDAAKSRYWARKARESRARGED